jgi:hypothetical protein
MIVVKVVPTSRGVGGAGGRDLLFGEERFHLLPVDGTYTGKCAELTQLTGPPRLAAPFFYDAKTDTGR